MPVDAAGAGQCLPLLFTPRWQWNPAPLKSWAQGPEGGGADPKALAKTVQRWVELGDTRETLELTGFGLLSIPHGLPRNVKKLDLSNNKIDLWPKLSELPPGLVELNLSINFLCSRCPSEYGQSAIRRLAFQNNPYYWAPEYQHCWKYLEDLRSWLAEVRGQTERESARRRAKRRLDSWLMEGVARGGYPRSDSEKERWMSEQGAVTLRCGGVIEFPPQLPPAMSSLTLVLKSGAVVDLSQLTRAPDTRELVVKPDHRSTASANGPVELRLPAMLPASLTKLSLTGVHLRVPPRLHEGLEEIDLTDNQITDIAGLIPRSAKHVALERNPISNLPEDSFTLPPTTRVSLSAVNFSTAVFNRIHTVCNSPDYSGPRIEFNMEERKVSRAVKTLEGEAREWYLETCGVHAVGDWSRLATKRSASAFAVFLNRLRDTMEYRLNATRENFRRRITALLNDLQDVKFASARRLCFKLAQSAIATCGDRVALSLLHMEQIFRNRRMKRAIRNGELDNSPERLLDHCRQDYRAQVIERAARDKTKTLSFVDEVEVHLGFIVALSREFALPTAMDALLYPVCSAIRPSDVQRVREQLTSSPLTREKKELYKSYFEKLPADQAQAALQELDQLPERLPASRGAPERDPEMDFIRSLTTSTPMLQMLRRTTRSTMAQINVRIATQVEVIKRGLHAELAELDPTEPGYEERCTALMRRFHSVEQEVPEQLRLQAVYDFLLRHGLTGLDGLT